MWKLILTFTVLTHGTYTFPSTTLSYETRFTCEHALDRLDMKALTAAQNRLLSKTRRAGRVTRSDAVCETVGGSSHYPFPDRIQIL